MTQSSQPLPPAPDLELEAIICRMGDYKDLVEMADLITTCLSDDSVGVLERPDSSPEGTARVSSSAEAESLDTDLSADVEEPPESVERSDLVLHLIPTDVPWAIMFLSSFSAVIYVDLDPFQALTVDVCRRGDGRRGSWPRTRSI